MENKDKIEIEPTDKNGKWHGYQEWYSNGYDMRILWVRCTHKHGTLIGYKESHHFLTTHFFIV